MIYQLCIPVEPAKEDLRTPAERERAEFSRGAWLGLAGGLLMGLLAAWAGYLVWLEMCR